MRQSQKTEAKADRLSRIDLENRKYTRARSTNSGEGKGVSVTFQDKVLDRNNLNQAYLRVKRNKGATGIDGLTVDELLPYLRENKEELIAKLKDGSYKPSPVKRVEIPKPNGGRRKLGIPTVVDRMVQQAIAQVLTPIFERVFSDNSFGFRPHRGAHFFRHAGLHRLPSFGLPQRLSPRRGQPGADPRASVSPPGRIARPAAFGCRCL